MMKKIYLLLLCMVLSSPVLFAQIFVTEAGAGNKDGSDWANAYEGDKLQQAINEAELTTEKQVWVAKGIYKPTENLSTTGFLTDGITPVTDRDKTFVLKTGVEIYGGFAGTEAAIGERVDIHTTNQTILSGDFLGNDIANPLDPLDAIPSLDPLDPTYNAGYAAYVDSKTDNTYHVVSSRNASAGSILDGLTITGGYADVANTITENGEDIPQNRGGGIALQGGNAGITLKNLIIQDCEAVGSSGAQGLGGGIFVSGSSFDFEQIRFENNRGHRGGGAYISLAASLVSNFSDCTFIGNSSSDISDSGGGGALYTADGEVNISNVLFDGNKTRRYGAAMRINGGTVNIKDNTIFENGYGTTRAGGIYSTGTSEVNIENSIFRNNATGNQGGHYYMFNGTVTVTNTLFEGGNSVGSGGVFFVASGVNKLDIFQSEFYNNTAEASAGVIYTTSNVNISKSRFYNNTAANQAGVIYIYTSSSSNSDVKIDNSIFYNNVANYNGTSTANVGGGVVYISRDASGQLATLTATNNTFYANKTPTSPHGAISFNGFADVTINLYNNIFNGNTGNGGSADVRRNTGATQTYSNNLFQNAISSSGNRTVVGPYYLDGTNPQPLFASTTEGDYDFLWPIENSFAIDKGDNTLYTNNVSDVATAKDLLGNDRLEGTTIDLGAIEWSIVLPVKVSSFTANLVNGRTQLKWDVGTEDNVNRYEVERSQNGTDFTTVATVGANGSSSYSTTDNSPALGVNYYRLVTIDNDGTRKAYDRVQTVTVATLASEGVSVYPNPATGSEVSISLGNVAVGTYTYKIVSTTGSVAQQGTLSYNGTSAVVSVGSLPAGVYVLQFSNGAQAKLIKQ